MRRSQFSNFTIENILGEHVGENEIEENENKNMLSRIKQEKIDILGNVFIPFTTFTHLVH